MTVLYVHIFMFISRAIKTGELLLEPYRYNNYQKGAFAQVKIPVLHKNEHHSGLKKIQPSQRI